MSKQSSLGFLTVLLATFSLILAGCEREPRQPGDTVRRYGLSPVTSVAADDPKMKAAMERARSTVDQFVKAFTNPQPSQDNFSIKLPVQDGEFVEQIWMLPQKYENGKFFGTISNEPLDVTTVRFGDSVEVSEAEISDWMYVENQKLVGGYTLRAMRDSLPDDERRELDQTVPFTID